MIFVTCGSAGDGILELLFHAPLDFVTCGKYFASKFSPVTQGVIIIKMISQIHPCHTQLFFVINIKAV